MKTTSKIINGNLCEFDSKGKEIHYKNSNRCETWYEYDSNGNMIHWEHDSLGT